MQKSVNDLNGKTIVATDGEIGTVGDFYFDDKSWTIRYLIARTGSWFQGKDVLLSPLLSARRIYRGTGSMSP